jgi:hypothetical protein
MYARDWPSDRENKILSGSLKIAWPKAPELTDEIEQDRLLIANTVLELINIPIRLLRRTWLDPFAHVGPLRIIPHDSVLSSDGSGGNKHDWFDGSAAWSRLAEPLSGAVADLNTVLAEPAWMNTGVSVESCSFKEFLHYREPNDNSQLAGDTYADSDDEVADADDGANADVLSEPESAAETTDKSQASEEITDPVDSLHEGLGPVETFIADTLEHSKTLKKNELVERFLQLSNLFPSQVTSQRVVFRDIQTKAEISPRHLATGLCQVIPVLVAVLDKGLPLIAVEQPELHLHPRLCNVLADLFVYAAVGKRPASFADTDRRISASPTRFMIMETHSEHLVKRLMQRVREAEGGTASNGWAKGFTAELLCVIYTERDDSSGSQMRRLRVNAKGEFAEGWPDGFLT